MLGRRFDAKHRLGELLDPADLRGERGRSFAVLDWGRGRWPYRTRWSWAAGSGLWRGTPIGVNLGMVDECALFAGGRVHKLAAATFDGARVATSDGRLSLELHPRLLRDFRLPLLLAGARIRQQFGALRGHALLDGGERVELDLAGFVEHASLRW